MNGQATATRRTRRSTFFDPDEVATVIDMFAPAVTGLHRYDARRPPVSRIDWERLAVVVAMMAALCSIGTVLQRPDLFPPRAEGSGDRSLVIAEQRREPAPRPPARMAAALPAAPDPRPPGRVVTIAEPTRPRLSVRIVAGPRRSGVAATLVALNRKAMAAYSHLQLQPAMRLLSRGLLMCGRPALAWNNLCALTHLNVGVVLAGGYKQTGLAAKHFRIAKAIDAGIAPSPRATRPEIAAAFRHASLPAGRL
jgi:hypothetical protein